MPQFSPEVLQRMREKAATVKKAMQGSGGNFARYADLSGKYAIVQPGEGVEVRMLPRWDFAAKRYTKDKAGKVVEDPKYVREECWFPSFDHWFDNRDGKRARAWCRKNLGPDETCPVCDAAKALWGGTEDERETAKRMGQNEIFLFNAILRSSPFTAEGKPDVRILRVPATVWSKFTDLCTGGDNEKYALGDVSDPWEGYDVRILRPAAQTDRYDLKAASKFSRLYEQADGAKWRGWQDMLWDLERDVLDQVPSVTDLEILLYGESKSAAKPAAPKRSSAVLAEAESDPFDGVGDVAGDSAPEGPEGEAATDGDPFGDIGMPEEKAPSPTPARPASRPAAGRTGRR